MGILSINPSILPRITISWGYRQALIYITLMRKRNPSAVPARAGIASEGVIVLVLENIARRKGLRRAVAAVYEYRTIQNQISIHKPSLSSLYDFT
jgi:hypothetical protein